MPRPRLTFFCELEAAPLQALFADPSVLESLQWLGAGVSLGLLDLGPERAAVVHRLNDAEIPVTAWLLLPPEEGYWLNAGNAPQAAARYAAFRTWTDERALQWAGIGLDFEPDLREVQWLQRRCWRIVPTLLRHLADRARLRAAQGNYCTLVGRARADGYSVESYLVPFVVDERWAGSDLLQRLAGLVDAPVDREVLMLYSSLARPNGSALLWSYGREAQAIGVGSTGGGVAIAGAPEVPVLSWEELSRDLRLAARYTREVYIYSLEGCVGQGLMPRLLAFDWEQPPAIPAQELKALQRVRRGLRALLWASAHPWLVTGGLLAVLWLLRPRRPH